MVSAGGLGSVDRPDLRWQLVKCENLERSSSTDTSRNLYRGKSVIQQKIGRSRHYYSRICLEEAGQVIE